MYADLPLATVDASIVAAAERLVEANVATLDRRHFTRLSRRASFSHLREWPREKGRPEAALLIERSRRTLRRHVTHKRAPVGQLRPWGIRDEFVREPDRPGGVGDCGRVVAPAPRVAPGEEVVSREAVVGPGSGGSDVDVTGAVHTVDRGISRRREEVRSNERESHRAL